MLDLYKEKFKFLEIKIAKIFSFFPLTPNQYTLSSLFFALLGLFFIYLSKLSLGLLFFLLAGFLDFIDGAVARYRKEESKKGAYLDTIVDRYVEGIILLSFIFLPFPKILFPSYIWIFFLLFGSLMTSYAKASAKEKELIKEELKGGLLSRGERLILIYLTVFLAIFSFKAAGYLLLILAVLTNISAISRIKLALAKLF